MVEWFRSQDMEFVSIIVNEDAAHSCVREIGNIGCVQFTDLNTELTPFQRRYVSSVKRCDELERKIRFFTAEIDKFGLPRTSETTVDQFMAAEAAEQQKTAVHMLETYEAELGEAESQLLELNSYSEKLTQEYNEKVELQEVLIKSQAFFEMDIPFRVVDEPAYNPLSGAGAGGETGGTGSAPLLDDGFAGRDDDVRFSFATGVIPLEDKARFERALFRNTRGNCYVRFAEIEQPVTDPIKGTLVQKLVFIIFYQSASIERKVKRICDAFGARRYAIPDPAGDNGQAIGAAMKTNLTDLSEARKVLIKNRDLRRILCEDLATKVENWLRVVVREKAVYHTLNLYKADVHGMLRGEGWIVADQLETVKTLVSESHATFDVAGSSLIEPVPKPWPTPPTSFALNDFTYPYQEFVETYGIPRYKEANPSLFTACTFPFLFGLMYGDIGHGTALLCGGLYLVYSYNPNARLDEMSGGIYSARYMIVMMGAFAIYAGLVYNDCFALALNLFGSNWMWNEGNEDDDELPVSGDIANSTCKYTSQLELKDAGADCVYPFGVDPAWHISENELLFFNSMKMKSSVIIGVMQMCVGICLRGMNAVYFGEWLDFYFEFLPMVVFAFGLFGYMIVVIFVKWSIDWQHRMYLGTCNEDNDMYLPGSHGAGCRDDPDAYELVDLCPLDYGGTGDGCQPPNLITTLINIALAPGSVDEPLYAGQATVQTIILLAAFGSVPVLLLGKPYFISRQMKQKHESDSRVALTSGGDFGDEYHKGLEEDGGHGHGEGGHDDHAEHDFSEIVIHQAIETIEFVLGMVSNTASYLRLWALSLAHSELATVFWEKAMLSTIEMGNPVAIFVGYSVFAGVTFAVLLCMDVLECFLHALRLHWVEFQNKFYKADGYKFQPFALKPILKDAI